MNESRPKILVVDDKPANLIVMRRLLADVDAEVTTAGSGNEALALCWKHEFALLLLDVQMPEMNGYEVAEILYETKSGKDLPVVLFITAAYTDEQHKLKGYDVGAIDYIQKPVNDKILLAKVNLFLEMYNKKQLEKKYAALFEEKNVLLQRELVEQKRMRELAESEERLRLVLQNMPVLMNAFDEEGNILVWNQECERTTGYSAQEIVGNPKAMELLYPDANYREWLMGEWQERGNHYRDWEWRITCKNGCVAVVSWSNISHRLRISGWATWGIGVDITERKTAEEELLRLRNLLHNIIDSMPSILMGIDLEGRVTQWNRTAERMTGTSARDAWGRDLSSVFPRLANELKKVEKAIRERQPQTLTKVTGLLGDENCFFDITIYPLVTNGVEGAVIRIDDVTDKVRMEEMMVQNEKMLSVGGLAAGMAHEINNPLAGMMQTANVMGRRLTDMDMTANRRAAEEVGISMDDIKAFMEKRGILHMITTINKSGRRVAAIVNNMLSFARKSEAILTSCDIEELLDKTLELAATDYDLRKQYDFKMIELRREYEENLPPVPCEEAKIQQVLLNILRNGAQAMQEAGTEKPRFIIRTRFEESWEMDVIEIEDNGPGMDEKTRKQIFEPFFTTKPVGAGLGLGLSVSYFIITENHNGEMTVESAPGAGARFIIRLPLKRRMS